MAWMIRHAETATEGEPGPAIFPFPLSLNLSPHGNFRSPDKLDAKWGRTAEHKKIADCIVRAG